MKNNRKAVEGRQRRLLSIVQERGTISVEELSEHLNVSSMTIRRDLADLAKQGLLIRQHGSASSITHVGLMSRNDPTIVKCRKALAVYAASLVEDGDKVFINGSRTALDILNYTGSKKVRVFTNNGWALDGKYPETVQIRMTGGIIYEHLLVGEYAVESLLSLSADKLFVGCAAVYADGQFRYDIPSEIGINEMMVSRTKGDIYVLADHSKLREKADAEMIYGCFRYPVPVTLITDELADPQILEKLENTGLRILTVSFDGTLTGGTSR